MKQATSAPKAAKKEQGIDKTARMTFAPGKIQNPNQPQPHQAQNNSAPPPQPKPQQKASWPPKKEPEPVPEPEPEPEYPEPIHKRFLRKLMRAMMLLMITKDMNNKAMKTKDMSKLEINHIMEKNNKTTMDIMRAESSSITESKEPKSNNMERSSNKSGNKFANSLSSYSKLFLLYLLSNISLRNKQKLHFLQYFP